MYVCVCVRIQNQFQYRHKNILGSEQIQYSENITHEEEE